MTEHGFIRSVHRHLPADVFVWKIHDSYSGGVPDVWYSGKDGKHLFIEYKYIKNMPRRATTPMKAALSELQRMWLVARQKDGIPVAVILGAEEQGILSPCIEDLVNGIERQEFQRRSRSSKELAAEIATRVGAK